MNKQKWIELKLYGNQEDIDILINAIEKCKKVFKI